MNLFEKLKTIFDEYGADIDSQDELLEIDSLKYIAIMVEIEKEFNIVIPDEYLTYNAFNDIESFVTMLGDLINIGASEEKCKITLEVQND